MVAQSLHLQMEKQAVHIASVILLFMRIGDLRARTWFGVVVNLAVHVLSATSLIYLCIRDLFPSEYKVVLWHFRPVFILLSL